ncbi:MAG: class I SAM-dependent methyltransferase [Desulfobulbus sp.]|nr:class I SAM-dependent methyltransferase [Desulfobulbus sp.]
MNPEQYDRWYEQGPGQWIGQRELSLLLSMLQIRPGESLLDVGCGTGYFTRGLAHATRTQQVLGVDINPVWVDFARRRDPGVTLYGVADGQALPFATDSFDLAVSITALCFVHDERLAVEEMVRVARRRVVIGLLNRYSLHWFRKGRHGGSGAYRGAHWHSAKEARNLFSGLPVHNVRLRTAIHVPGSGWFARAAERLLPPQLHTGAFILLAADVN